MLVGVLAIAGTPLFSGWYSKDAILAESMGFVLMPGQGHHFFLGQSSTLPRLALFAAAWRLSPRSRLQ